jgi:hypothetical protein
LVTMAPLDGRSLLVHITPYFLHILAYIVIFVNILGVF